jgi:predicted RNA binding protein YcfA (HicA-like mRNA interferase family)
MKFSELVRMLEQNGFRLIKEKGSVRYYGKPAWTGSFESTIMALKKFLREPATPYSKQPG